MCCCLETRGLLVATRAAPAGFGNLGRCRPHTSPPGISGEVFYYQSRLSKRPGKGPPFLPVALFSAAVPRTKALLLAAVPAPPLRPGRRCLCSRAQAVVPPFFPFWAVRQGLGRRLSLRTGWGRGPGNPRGAPDPRGASGVQSREGAGGSAAAATSFFVRLPTGSADGPGTQRPALGLPQVLAPLQKPAGRRAAVAPPKYLPLHRPPTRLGLALPCLAAGDTFCLIMLPFLRLSLA